MSVCVQHNLSVSDLTQFLRTPVRRTHVRRTHVRLYARPRTLTCAWRVNVSREKTAPQKRAPHCPSNRGVLFAAALISHVPSICALCSRTATRMLWFLSGKPEQASEYNEHYPHNVNQRLSHMLSPT